MLMHGRRGRGVFRRRRAVAGLGRRGLLLPGAPFAAGVDLVRLVRHAIIVIIFIDVSVVIIFVDASVVIIMIGFSVVVVVLRVVQSGKLSLDSVCALDVLDHRQDGALRPDVAGGGELDLAAQDRLDGRHRLGAAVLHHDHAAVGFLQRQLLEAFGRRPARPSARIAGPALLELRVPGRLAVSYLVGGGVHMGGGHQGESSHGRVGSSKNGRSDQSEWKVCRIGKSAGPENLQTGRAAKGQIQVYNYLENSQ